MTIRESLVRLVAAGLLLAAMGAAANVNTPKFESRAPRIQHLSPLEWLQIGWERNCAASSSETCS